MNRCKDVTIHIKQSGLPSRVPLGYNAAQQRSSAASGACSNRLDWDSLPVEWAGSGPVPFAWDEPQLFHRLDVVATSHGSQEPHLHGEVNGQACKIMRATAKALSASVVIVSQHAQK